MGLPHRRHCVMKAAVLVAYGILAAVAASLPTPIWDPVAHSILRWNASWPLYRNTPDTALLPPPPAAHAYVVSGGSAIGDIARGHLNGGYNSRYYYLKPGNTQFGTLDRNTEMRQFQEGMAMDAAQSPLPVGITEPMLTATGLADWDTGAACAKVSAPELTDRSALVLVVDRFPMSKGGKNESKVDMAWDLASLFVGAIDPSSRCWDGMNVYDTKSGKPCIQLQFVECSFRDGPAGDEVPLSLGFMFPTQTLGHDKWNLKFQLNYKKHPVRAVQVVSADGQVHDAQFGYGAWQVEHVSGTPFRFNISYGDTDASGGYIYHTSQPVMPPASVTKKSSWPSDRYKQGDFSHVVSVPLQFH